MNGGRKMSFAGIVKKVLPMQKKTVIKRKKMRRQKLRKLVNKQSIY